MKDYNELKSRNIDQIRDVINVYNEVNNIALNVNLNLNSNKIESLIKDLRQHGSRFDINMDGIMEADRAFSSTKIFVFKKVLARKIAELANILIELYENSSKPDVIETSSVELENLLGKLGYALFELPLGSQFDFSLDPMFADISNKEYVNKFSKHKTFPMYISKSTFGCAENRNGVYGRVIERAKVELTEDPKTIGEKKSEGKQAGKS